MAQKFFKIMIAAIFMMGSISMARAADDLKITVLQEGSGEPVEIFSGVTVHYTGWLMDGTKFDSSVDRGQPFQFLLGAGQVIQGWEQGVKGMKVGEKRELIIPSRLAYGDSGAGSIPPGATLKFEVELLGVEPGPVSLASADELNEALKAGSSAVDIRSEQEWKETGTIANVEKIAAFLNDGAFRTEFVNELTSYSGPEDTIYIISTGGDIRGMQISLGIAVRLGYQKVFLLRDGIESWMEAGLPIEK